ncbi:MAG TPA: class I SAM-dependent methyltransferase, partial [Gemmatimonadaceae bacterium]|nr:class I SAM-dependent methyltransferase [Gemmatimonadaceae bacterium]
MNSDCPACHATEATPFFESVDKDFSWAGYPYVRCAVCETVFNAACPAQVELTALHRDRWYSPGAFRYPDAGRGAILGHWAKTMAEAAEAVKARRAGKPRHLDIGCGYGACCEALREKGFQSTGVDPSPDSIETAKREFPLNDFFTASLGDHGLPELQGTWDLVTLNDVIEHVVSPDLLMSEVGRVTGAGSLVYVQAPSAASLQLAYLREHAFHSMAPFHRTLFSLAGLTRLLDRNGFDVVSVLPSHINWGWTRALSFQLGSPAEYERLRQDAAFRALDLAIDTLFDRIAIDQGRAPS